MNTTTIVNISNGDEIPTLRLTDGKGTIFTIPLTRQQSKNIDSKEINVNMMEEEGITLSKGISSFNNDVNLQKTKIGKYFYPDELFKNDIMACDSIQSPLVLGFSGTDIEECFTENAFGAKEKGQLHHLVRTLKREFPYIFTTMEFCKAHNIVSKATVYVKRKKCNETRNFYSIALLPFLLTVVPFSKFVDKNDKETAIPMIIQDVILSIKNSADYKQLIIDSNFNGRDNQTLMFYDAICKQLQFNLNKVSQHLLFKDPLEVDNNNNNGNEQKKRKEAENNNNSEGESTEDESTIAAATVDNNNDKENIKIKLHDLESKMASVTNTSAILVRKIRKQDSDYIKSTLIIDDFHKFVSEEFIALYQKINDLEEKVYSMSGEEQQQKRNPLVPRKFKEEIPKLPFKKRKITNNNNNNNNKNIINNNKKRERRKVTVIDDDNYSSESSYSSYSSSSSSYSSSSDDNS